MLGIITEFIKEFCESFVLNMANQILSVMPFEAMTIVSDDPQENLNQIWFQSFLL